MNQFITKTKLQTIDLEICRKLIIEPGQCLQHPQQKRNLNTFSQLTLQNPAMQTMQLHVSFKRVPGQEILQSA